MDMDKMLLTVFLSALVGFITAVVSIVKLVNEKESKTTDYRQEWTNSVRRAFADLIARVNAQATNVVSQCDDIKEINNSSDENNEAEHVLEVGKNSLLNTRKVIMETRHAIHEAYAFAALHFKSNDLSFSRVEHKFDMIIDAFDKLAGVHPYDEVKQTELKGKIYSATNEISNYARDILESQWETVKQGEPAYKLTKKWSIWCSVVMLFILLAIGVHADWKPNAHIKQNEISNTSVDMDKQIKPKTTEESEKQS